MPISDFIECMLADQIEPFIDRRADLLAGIVSSVIANVQRDPKSKPHVPGDFMPNWDREQRQVFSPEQERKKLLIFQTVQNAKIAAMEARKKRA